MADILAALAFLILAITLLALLRVLRSRVLAERVMALQLLGTGGTAVLLLLGAASGSAAGESESFSSSSEMIWRMEARISSIDGSCSGVCPAIQ